MELLKEQLNSALASLNTLGKLLLPTLDKGVIAFAPWQGQAYDERIINTDIPPKQALLPQAEAVYAFAENSLQEIVCTDKQVLFGLRPCDVQAINCLDKVFANDAVYLGRRENVTLIAITCSKAAATCFCGSMQVDAGLAPAADLVLKPTVNGWNIYSQSAKGHLALAAVENFCLKQAGEELPPAIARLQVDIDEIGPKLPALTAHPLWDELCLPCLGCGACTFICPGCYCFDMGPERRGLKGKENRYWDSCMFAEYSAMAGGYNPRPALKDRLRNRYLHKLSYFYGQYGQSLCVGCGRCISKCPAGLDIAAFIEMIGEVATS